MTKHGLGWARQVRCCRPQAPSLFCSIWTNEIKNTVMPSSKRGKWKTSGCVPVHWHVLQFCSNAQFSWLTLGDKSKVVKPPTFCLHNQPPSAHVTSLLLFWVIQLRSGRGDHGGLYCTEIPLTWPLIAKSFGHFWRIKLWLLIESGLLLLSVSFPFLLLSGVNSSRDVEPAHGALSGMFVLTAICFPDLKCPWGIVSTLSQILEILYCLRWPIWNRFVSTLKMCRRGIKAVFSPKLLGRLLWEILPSVVQLLVTDHNCNDISRDFHYFLKLSNGEQK